MAMTISIDDTLKQDFNEVCKELGMSSSAAFCVFAKAVVRERAIPFKISANSEYEQQVRAYERVLNAEISKAYEAVQAGNYITREEAQQARQSLTPNQA